MSRWCDLKGIGMENLSRRQFGQGTLASLLTFSLLESLFDCDAFAAEIKPDVVRWLNRVNEMSQDLRDERLKQLEWQAKIEELFAQADLPELMKYVEFEKLTANLKLADRGEKSLRFNFQAIDGTPQRLVFGKQIFALKKGSSVVPHGHNNMATAFLILKGQFRGRHYDRIEDQAEHMIIRPTIDRQFGVGECSTVSDFKDNVHWFQSVADEPAFILNIHVLGVNPASKLPTGRVYVDPNGEKLSDGLVRARRIKHDEANKLYG
ncbi:MAG: hypothetical protein KDA71_00115 [Planctomycetales bacterium]|nr:hypothetical protein [Planctomycetales bacterium]